MPNKGSKVAAAFPFEVRLHYQHILIQKSLAMQMNYFLTVCVVKGTARLVLQSEKWKYVVIKAQEFMFFLRQAAAAAAPKAEYVWRFSRSPLLRMLNLHFGKRLTSWFI